MVSRRLPAALAALVVLIGAALIASTYRQLSPTFDEPVTIATGLEWLSLGQYRHEAAHPPLGRVLAAIGPYLAGERTRDTSDMWRDGREILGRGDHLVRTTAFARAGELIFYFVLCWSTWALARRAGNEWIAAVAVVLVALEPSVMAHAGLATTDIGAAACVPLALLAWLRWLDDPSRPRSLLAGVAVGVAAVTKFSTLGFLGLALPLAYVVRARELGNWRFMSRRTFAQSVSLGIGAAFTTIWAVYRFDVGAFHGWTLPAPRFFEGIADFGSHGQGGHPAFLLGSVRTTGWWYYYPVALLVKTSIPLLMTAAVGLVATVRRWRVAPNVAAATMISTLCAVIVVAMSSRVDLGVRLVLAVYPCLAVLGAVGVAALWRQPRIARLVAAGAIAATTLGSIGAHPDYLAHFNALAGPHPEWVLSDSNIDWGQDLYRVRDVVRRSHIDTLRLAYFGSISPVAAEVPNTIDLPPGARPRGWVAVSETFLAGLWVDTSYAWLTQLPARGTIGRSIRVYYIP